MGERKVQAKYYPPDFDPSRLPKIKKKTQNDDAVRFMLPMSVRCETCGEFMGAGLKFNARKSDTGDKYLGIKIFRFAMRCKSCPATFTIRTDPENRNYSCESGVRRNYEPWREAEAAAEEGKEERKRQDEDSIQALENKTRDAKKEMEDLDELDEIRTINAKRAKLDVDFILARDKAAADERARAVEHEIRVEAKRVFEANRKVTEPDSEFTSASVPLSRANKKDHLPISAKLSGIRTSRLKVVKKVVVDQSPPKGERNVEPEQVIVDYASSSDSD